MLVFSKINLVRFFLVVGSALFAIDVKQSHTFTQLMEGYPIHTSNAIAEGVQTIYKGSIEEMEKIDFHPLSGGLGSSGLFSFTLAGKKYVLRVLEGNAQKDSSLTKDKRMREILTHQTACKMGVAPEIAYVDPEGLIVMMEFIDGHLLNREDLKDENLLSLLGASIARLHGSMTSLPLKYTQKMRIKKHYERSKKNGIAFPSCFEDNYNLLLQEKGFLDNQVLCHGDLHPGNIIIKNGRPVFIDFAEGSCDRSFLDLGFLTFAIGMNREQSSIFLKGYLGRDPSLSEYKMLELGEARACFLVAVIWFGFSETLDDLSRPVSERIDLLDKLLDSSTLKLGHEYILNQERVNPHLATSTEIQKFALGFFKEYLIRMKNLSTQGPVKI
jgi:aminoglycoside phosphotransferase